MTSIYRALDGELSATGEWLQLLQFSGGEPHVNVLDEAAVAGGSFVIDVRGGTFGALGEMLVASDALRRHGAATVQLFLPYLPGARQDRGAPLTCKVVADLVNSAGFDRVICLDPHSPVMPAMIDRLAVIDPVETIDGRFFEGGDTVVVCPDAGAAARAEAVAARFGRPIVHARKHRDPRFGEVQQVECDPLPTGSIGVVVDDICDGGATFLHLARAIGSPAASLRLWTTHGIYARGLDELRTHYSLIGCTDSCPTTSTPDVHRSARALLEQFLASTPL